MGKILAFRHSRRCQRPGFRPQGVVSGPLLQLTRAMQKEYKPNVARFYVCNQCFRKHFCSCYPFQGLHLNYIFLSIVFVKLQLHSSNKQATEHIDLARKSSFISGYVQRGSVGLGVGRSGFSGSSMHQEMQGSRMSLVIHQLSHLCRELKYAGNYALALKDTT